MEGIDGPLRVLALDDYQGLAQRLGPWSRLDGAVVLDVERSHVATDDGLVARARDANVLLAMRERTPLTRQRLERLPELRLIITKGISNDAIDVDAAAELGIVVCGTSRVGSPTIELTWGLILGLMRRICAEDRGMHGGGWQHTVGTELQGARLGVVGLGNLGSQVARIGQAFGMDVVAWSQNLQEQHAREVGVRAVSKEELFRTSDLVTVHLRSSPRTIGIIGSQELSWMPPHAYLVNTSRGPLVDEQALVEALRSGAIAGAGLDVFDTEPLPALHPLRTFPDVILTPHIGYVTERGLRAFYEEAVDCLAAWRAGRPIGVIAPRGRIA